MRHGRVATLFAAFMLGVLGSASALAQSAWPAKPVKFIVPFAPGGATDVAARMLGQKLAEIWGQAVVVENRAGAGGALGAVEAARAAPDGYTLFFPSGSVMTANQHVYAKLAYDPEKDFVPVTNVVSGPQLLVVSAKSPYKTVQDLVDAARANPGKLAFGHAGIGSQTHLAGENLAYRAKIDVLAVPYKGETPALAAVLGGEIAFALSNMAGSIGHVQGGRLRALGVTSLGVLAQLPDVPPVGATVAGYENSGWFGIVAPAGTPKDIIRKVYEDTKKVLEQPDVKARFLAQGLFPVANTPEEMGAAMKEETKLWAAVVRERKIRVE